MISKNTSRKIMALLALILLAGLVVPPVSADYWETLTSINTTSWQDMTHNITHMRDVTIPAMKGNGSVVMDNVPATGTVNFTASWLQANTGGTTSLNFTTPSTGSYLITANLRENTTLTAPPASSIYVYYALCDANGTTIVPNTERRSAIVTDIYNLTAITKSFNWIYTNTTGTSEVGVCAKVSESVDGFYGLVSDEYGRSVLNYMKLA